MKLKKITFILENCDWIDIDGKYIGEFIVKDLETEFARIASNSITKIDKANFIAVEIHRDANTRYSQFEQPYEDFKRFKFDRLKCGDITSIEFELEELYPDDENCVRKEMYSYYTSWTGDSDFINESQSCYISNGGHLYLVINKDTNAHDYFENIDDEDYNDFRFSMYEIGDKYCKGDIENEYSN